MLSNGNPVDGKFSNERSVDAKSLRPLVLGTEGNSILAKSDIVQQTSCLPYGSVISMKELEPFVRE
jgi:hypothetical protein